MVVGGGYGPIVWASPIAWAPQAQWECCAVPHWKADVQVLRKDSPAPSTQSNVERVLGLGLAGGCEEGGAVIQM